MTEHTSDIHIGPHRILVGDVRERLRDLPDDSVHCVVTSPPYYGLRDYGVSGQIGLESTLADYLATMVDVFREVRRVLRPDGTVWLNIGDSYASSGGVHTSGSYDGALGRKMSGVDRSGRMVSGMKPKDLMMVPARLAIALQDDGWWLRSDIIWVKKAPMPESVTDRPTSAHEHVFLLAKQPRYYYDADAVREEASGESYAFRNGLGYVDQGMAPNNTNHQGKIHRADYDPSKRNSRNVWLLGPEPFPEAHFATFPTEIPRRAIKAGCPEGGAVLDPFLGSGTTMLVAEELNRACIGIELNPEYAAMAVKRVGPHRPRLALEIA